MSDIFLVHMLNVELLYKFDKRVESNFSNLNDVCRYGNVKQLARWSLSTAADVDTTLIIRCCGAARMCAINS